MDFDRVFGRALIGDGCWDWQGACQNKGYGELMVDRRMWTAHRASWTAWHGPIPAGVWVLHHRDNCRCVRPDHLYLGNNSDNMRHCAARGRLNSQNRRADRCHM